MMDYNICFIEKLFKNYDRATPFSEAKIQYESDEKFLIIMK